MFIKLKAAGIKVGDQRLEPLGPPIKVEMLRLWVGDLQSPGPQLASGWGAVKAKGRGQTSQ